MAAVSFKAIKESLIDQLKAKDAEVDCFIDLIDAYIFYTKKEREMQRDINKRGLFFEATSSAGKTYIKDNPSIKNSVLYNKQRLAILEKLGLNVDNVESEFDDEL